eukprot:jgi/Picre1/33998/NNA_001475.t1
MSSSGRRLEETTRWVEEEALFAVGEGEVPSFSSSSQNTNFNDDEEGPIVVVSGNYLDDGRRGTKHQEPGFFGVQMDSASWKAFLVHMGPGFLMCIAYIDPGNLEADLQTGVGTGYSLLWVLLWSTVLGGVLQSLAAKLGVSTSMHLAQHCRTVYPRYMRYILWVMAELAIIGSDIQEVIGSSLALMLLTGGAMPLWLGVVIGAVTAYLLLFLEKFGLKWLEGFFQMLVGILGVCMAVLFFVAKVPYGRVLHGLAVPTLSIESLPTATGLLGAIIMPHNLFLHSALVHERGIPVEYRSTAKHSLWYYKLESAFALFVTLGINTAVISVFSHGFHKEGEATADIGLFNAGQFLGDKYGPAMALVWAIGLLAAGQSSTMTGTYAGQFVMSGFLNLKMGPYKRALLTRTAYQTALTVLAGKSWILHTGFWLIALVYLGAVICLTYLSFQSLCHQSAQDDEVEDRPSTTDPLLSVVREEEEMLEDDVVKAAGTYAPPVVPPVRLPLTDAQQVTSGVTTPRSVASSSMLQSSRYGPVALRIMSGSNCQELFQPLKVGSMDLAHRIVYAPLTRCRALTSVPVQMSVQYYSERATKGGLMITEGTIVSEHGFGYPCTPGIFTKEQVEGWKPIVKAVKEKGAFMFCQIWHCGRASHQHYQPNGETPISCSDVPIKGQQCFSSKSMQMEDYPVPRALDKEELPKIAEQFRMAAKNAIEAGFDGVEIHGANGYLLDSFMKDGINNRTDEYGGSIENRCRFPLEVVQAVCDEIGAERVGYRLSPFGGFLDAHDSHPYASVSYMIEELNRFGLAYIHCLEPRVKGNTDQEADPHFSLAPFRKICRTVFIASGGYVPQDAADAIGSGSADLVAFGRRYLANPDFVKRIKLGAPLNEYDRSTFYTQGAEGYIDYPFLEDTRGP